MYLILKYVPSKIWYTFVDVFVASLKKCLLSMRQYVGKYWLKRKGTFLVFSVFVSLYYSIFLRAGTNDIFANVTI